MTRFPISGNVIDVQEGNGWVFVTEDLGNGMKCIMAKEKDNDN